MRLPERCDDRGQVTAETAVVVPSLLLLLGMLLWGLMSASALIQCVDAARAGARAAARGESREAVVRAARSAAPGGAVVELSREGALIRVRVRAESAGPGPLTVPLRAVAVAMAEPTEEEAR
ncbi:pilus assembly protein [Streptomyces sp. N2-109]|uniref:Pilus assembly protein n=1 Tax=Streptomyces gossypii TaxID=2883101 RepID=A0ABT2JQ95_9ACTN|nr:TadE family type IV pilus minor pilin [Streptomyces gossypii]MCT2589916.1 pilus assembly protein [Streptomyces gossypii]